jgi:hypothetical protein
MIKRPAIQKNIDTPKQPWISSPYSLISWWDMEKFSAEEFYQIGEFLGRMAETLRDGGGTSHDRLSQIVGRGGLLEEVAGIVDLCETVGLKVSVICGQEFLNAMEQEDLTFGDVHKRFEHLGNLIRMEMQTVLFFHLPTSQAEFYNNKHLFGAEVSAKFPDLQYDIIEAGNCLALGRSTACVFHLMRIMEVGTQVFGRRLGVTFTESKNWQNILDESNKAIKALPKGKDAVELSQTSASLFAVKVAWRNQVMHPHDKYTLEEAEDVLRQVKSFMKSMAKLELPPMGSSLIQ